MSSKWQPGHAPGMLSGKPKIEMVRLMSGRRVLTDLVRPGPGPKIGFVRIRFFEFFFSVQRNPNLSKTSAKLRKDES
jgi:hypothetical protein